eukprot:8998495-Alexandrium_andersonii.AAC.1
MATGKTKVAIHSASALKPNCAVAQSISLGSARDLTGAMCTLKQSVACVSARGALSTSSAWNCGGSAFHSAARNRTGATMAG